jgi:kinesin family member 6/9
MHNASQESLFDYCAAESVASVVDGFNGTIMCYGQTGSGKTFSMTGSTANFKYRGIIPRAISKIFSEVGGRFDTQITVKISYVEIYNELLFDMLSGCPPHEQTGTDIHVQDDNKGEVHLKGLTMVHCKSEEEALNALFEGEQNRTVADNAINKTSSRSHAIFTIHLESRSTIETSEKVIHSRLSLVDLAGSERTKKTGA